MGNSRGNLYSRQHDNLSIESDEYWKFSWDEMSRYDLPAMIETALRISRQSSLYYIAHSQGTEIMFTKLSLDAEFGKKVRRPSTYTIHVCLQIKKCFMLAPVATVNHIKGLFSFLATHFGGEIEVLTLKISFLSVPLSFRKSSICLDRMNSYRIIG